MNESPPSPGGTESADRLMEVRTADERAAAVRRLDASLSVRQRAVLRLYFRGDSYMAMGAALGMQDPGATLTAIRLKYKAQGLTLKGRGRGRGQNVLPIPDRRWKTGKGKANGKKPTRLRILPKGRMMRTEARTTNTEVPA